MADCWPSIEKATCILKLQCTQAPSHFLAIPFQTHLIQPNDRRAGPPPQWMPEQQRLIESTLRSLREASDEEILGMTQGMMARIAVSLGRGDLVLRALERAC